MPAAVAVGRSCMTGEWARLRASYARGATAACRMYTAGSACTRASGVRGRLRTGRVKGG